MIMHTDEEAFDDGMYYEMEGPVCSQNNGGFEVCVHDSCITIQIEAGPPCRTCGYAWDCDDCIAEQHYSLYLDERIAKFGILLSMLPDEMECYDCGRNLPAFMTKVDSWGMRYFMRRVVGEGPIANHLQDPTSTYRLACGHYTM